MIEIDNFKVFVLCSDDVTADVDHLHAKRIHLVGFSYHRGCRKHPISLWFIFKLFLSFAL
jgi:hypothetical protein